MSRTHRRRNITDSMSKKKFIDMNVESKYIDYKWHRYISDHDQLRYENDCLDYRRKMREYCKVASNEIPYLPQEYAYYSFKKIKIEYDMVEETKAVSDEYDTFSRDGFYNNTPLNFSYKKHCSKDLRHKSKQYLNKVIKDPEHWYEELQPDAYMGKKYIWDYW